MTPVTFETCRQHQRACRGGWEMTGRRGSDVLIELAVMPALARFRA
jgi:hypothetical protein